MFRRHFRIIAATVLAGMLLVIFLPVICRRVAVRAETYMGAGIWPEAIRQYRKALFLGCADAECLNGLGYAYRAAGDAATALHMYRRTLSRYPYNPVACHDCAMIYIRQKRFRRAEVFLLRLVRGCEDYGACDDSNGDFYYRTALFLLSLCAEKRGDNAAALEYARRYCIRFPDDAKGPVRLKDMLDDAAPVIRKNPS